MNDMSNAKRDNTVRTYAADLTAVAAQTKPFESTLDDWSENVWSAFEYFSTRMEKYLDAGEPEPEPEPEPIPVEPKWKLQDGVWVMAPWTASDIHPSVKRGFRPNFDSQQFIAGNVKYYSIPDFATGLPENFWSLGWFISGDRWTDWKKRLCNFEISPESSDSNFYTIRGSTAIDQKSVRVHKSPSEAFQATITFEHSRSVLSIRNKVGDVQFLELRHGIDLSNGDKLLFGLGHDTDNEQQSIGWTYPEGCRVQLEQRERGSRENSGEDSGEGVPWVGGVV